MKTVLKSSKLELDLNQIETNEIISIKIVEQKLYNLISGCSGVVSEMYTHILNSGGKRVRPLLVLYSGLAFSDISEDLVTASAAAELIHMATLAHDDVIDKSELRRNRPSLNKLWGNQFSILCGDFLFSKAFGILSGNKLFKSLDLMIEAIDNMCNGEILQADNSFNFTMDINDYYKQIEKKTAIFIQCCCKSGAAIGGANEQQIKAIGEYGLNIGLAFQIIDDILDFCGNPIVTGKPQGEDLRQGILTLPLLLLLSDDKYEHQLKKIITKKVYNDEDYSFIADILCSSGAIEKSQKIAAAHIDKAQEYLKFIPNSQYKDLLYNFAEMLKLRNN